MGIYNMVNSTCQKAACCYYKKDTKNLVNFHNCNFPRQIKIYLSVINTALHGEPSAPDKFNGTAFKK